MSTMTKTSQSPSFCTTCMALYVMALISVPLCGRVAVLSGDAGVTTAGRGSWQWRPPAQWQQWL